VWVNLIIRATEEWRTGKMHDSFSTTKQLYAWLPQACKKDCKPTLDKLYADLEKITVRDANYINRHVRLFRAVEKFLCPRLLELHEKIQESLETHGWICKPVGASPQVKHKKEAWA
jgi:hypothetical protein